MQFLSQFKNTFNLNQKCETEGQNKKELFESNDWLDNLPDEALNVLEKIHNESSIEDRQESYLNKLFKQEYDNKVVSGKFFYGCPFSLYHLSYKIRVSDFIENYRDAYEIDFIKEELKCFNSIKLPDFLFDEISKDINFSIDRCKEFLVNTLNNLGYAIDHPEETSTIRKISDKITPYQQINNSKITWLSNDIDLIEIGKSIYACGLISKNITQVEFLNNFCLFFNKHKVDQKKALQNIKKRIEPPKTLIKMEDALTRWAYDES